jgi:aminoglycoside 3-N-acetyltransferase I
MSSKIEMEIRRFGRGDAAVARRLFTVMADVFEEESRPLGDAYLDHLLSRAEFWALGAFVDGDVVGGLTAHTLPMTRTESFEIFIYDIAVRADKQRLGIGRRLIAALRDMAAAQGIHDVFVPADDDDAHALEFYRALGATGSPVTFFTFSRADHD